MDEKTVDTLARRAGLEKALREFRDDVADAASSAEKMTDRVGRSGGTPPASLEPWPPMVVRA
jgi:hypothetical protein